jgi:cytochrome c-type biogenesis protein CcmF
VPLARRYFYNPIQLSALNQSFIGEHLLPGQLGHLFVILSFVAALFSAFAYYNAARKEDITDGAFWKKLGRLSFIIQAISVAGIFITLYYIISSHLFEYNYAWKHSSRGLQVKYLLSCFWEGSEGSFLLWLVWHAVLGLILMRKSKQWETRVMAVVALVQAVLCTMLLGIYFGADIKIGSNPFTLLRNEMQGAPIFSQPNYLEFIKDGNGLNITLQNYWMVIHPPILFLGFALTLIPFAYAVAALWKGEYKTWVKPALRWTLVCGAVLGTGIMMGGAWAYESLTFGGYWAWDPVENASLVPWLTLVAGLHTLVIYKSTGRSLKTTLIFFILTFVLIWYSTFLTRTGILGETSVHSFTGEGKALYWHLLIALGLFLIISLFPLVRSWKKMPRVAGEEEVDTREFWMLIGSIFLLIAALQIIFTTSMPVWAPLYKSVTGTDIAPATDPVKYYNDIQVWAAFIIGVLSASIQFLKYKKTGMKAVWKKLALLIAISLVLTVLLVIGQKIEHMQYMTFTFAIMFTITGNLFYLFTTQKGKVLRAGGSVAHFGFGLMLFGILLSGYKKQIISMDAAGANRNMDFGKKTFEENLKESRENVLLFRNTTIPMGKYMVTYLGDSTVKNDPPLTFYKIRYDRRDPETNDLLETFYLYPEAYVNPKGQEGISANPDAKHYWSHDVFTYLTSISNPESKTDTSTYQPHTVKNGDSIFLANAVLVFEGLNSNVDNRNYKAQPGDVAAQAKLTAYNIDGKMGTSSPVYIIRGNEATSLDDTLRDLGLNIRINKIIPDQQATEIGVRQRAAQDDYIILKAIVFPFIRVLWLGVIIMVIGFFLSWWYRRSEGASRTVSAKGNTVNKK